MKVGTSWWSKVLIFSKETASVRQHSVYIFKEMGIVSLYNILS